MHGIGEIAPSVSGGAEFASDHAVLLQDEGGGSVRSGGETRGKPGGSASADNDVE